MTETPDSAPNPDERPDGARRHHHIERIDRCATMHLKGRDAGRKGEDEGVADEPSAGEHDLVAREDRQACSRLRDGLHPACSWNRCARGARWGGRGPRGAGEHIGGAFHLAAPALQTAGQAQAQVEGVVAQIDARAQRGAQVQSNTPRHRLTGRHLQRHGAHIARRVCHAGGGRLAVRGPFDM